MSSSYVIARSDLPLLASSSPRKHWYWRVICLSASPRPSRRMIFATASVKASGVPEWDLIFSQIFRRKASPSNPEGGVDGVSTIGGSSLAQGSFWLILPPTEQGACLPGHFDTLGCPPPPPMASVEFAIATRLIRPGWEGRRQWRRSRGLTFPPWPALHPKQTPLSPAPPFLQLLQLPRKSGFFRQERDGLAVGILHVLGRHPQPTKGAGQFPPGPGMTGG